ncbi:hypothetical protein TrLO_g1852 [Triparma laevis f. longispina]|uniref:SPX domain-containing protein n=1 Tax=Triparma laevis f. longispina TaxID=1714387 RepID=A0A9W7AG30_9STRA|nr:hypothetical protein TrLO_g1852 [Triparma laevis f. longispina]
MKFCKNLQRMIDLSNPEWTPFWVNYKMLKKVIKEIQNPEIVQKKDSDSDNEASEVKTTKSTKGKAGKGKKAEEESKPQQQQATPAAQQQQQQPNLPDTNRTDMSKSPGEVAFFKLLHSELKKAQHFFDRAQREFAIREERVKDAMDYCGKPGALMVQDRWSQLAKALYRFYKDLLLLENYAIMTFCSFSKILKKHDKNTGFKTREAFMTNVVSTANFSNYPVVVKMLKNSQVLFQEVATKLQLEGKGDLHRDERLFIDMIHRLNRQASEVQQEEAKDIAKGEETSPARLSKPITINEVLTGAPEQDDIKKKMELMQDLIRENSEDKQNEANAKREAPALVEADGTGRSKKVKS